VLRVVAVDLMVIKMGASGIQRGSTDFCRDKIASFVLSMCISVLYCEFDGWVSVGNADTTTVSVYNTLS
jgi:hypothetical protein